MNSTRILTGSMLLAIWVGSSAGVVGMDEAPVAFLGSDRSPLPLQSPAELETFLSEARVVSSKAAPGGITGARKLLLERDGVSAHAIFRCVAKTALVQPMPHGRVQPYFRDHHVNEVAAYELSKLIGLNAVPPTVARRIDGVTGSLQLWIEGAVTETGFRRRERQLAPLERVRHALQIDQMKVFDNLIHNIDRNLGNFLTDAQGRVWYVDHTRSFLRLPVLPQASAVARVDRELWKRLQELGDASLVETLTPYLPAPEVRGLLARRRELVALLAARLEEKSQARVLFSMAWARTPR
jgi:hypothetical protein